MKKRTKQIGQRAELLFQRLCADAGIPCQRATEDVSGWDFMIELPGVGASLGLPLDLHAPGQKLFVQVKGTDGQTHKDIKLSNWRNLTNMLEPVFFFVVDFDDQNEPRAAYLVHLGEALVARVIERLVSLSGESNPKLHEKRLRLTWTEGERLDPLTGEEMLARIIEAIAKDAHDYASRKQRWIRESGYGDTPFRGNLSFSAESEADFHAMFVDFAIGLTDALEADSGTVIDRRFGHERPLGTGEEVQSQFRVQRSEASSMPAVVRFSTPDGLKHATFDCEMYHPRMVFEWLPPESWKLRLVGPGLDILLHWAEKRWEFLSAEPDPDERYPLRQLREAYVLADLLNHPGQSGEKLELLVTIDGKRALEGELGNVDCEMVDAKRARAELADAAWAVASYFGLPETHPVSLEELVGQEAGIVRTAHLVRPENRTMIKVSWTALQEAPDSQEPVVRETLTVACLGDYLCLAGFIFEFTARVIESNEDEKMQCQGRVDEIHGIFKKVIAHHHEDVDLAPYRQAFERWFQQNPDVRRLIDEEASLT